MKADERGLRIADRSGTDVDVWGGDLDRPMVVIPDRDEPCILKVEGECPPGCRRCLDFAEELSKPQPTEDIDDGNL